MVSLLSFYVDSQCDGVLHIARFVNDKPTSLGSSEAEAGVDDGIVDDASDKEIVLRKRDRGQQVRYFISVMNCVAQICEFRSQIVIGSLAFFMDDLDDSCLERGKTVIRLKGVKIVKQNFPLKGDVFQDTVIEVSVV